jgi:predicted PurR-regulated permease PerM
MGSLFYSSGKTFAAEFPKYGEKIGSILSSIQERLKIAGLEWESVDWTQQFGVNKLGSFLLSTLGPFFGFLSNLFLIFIFLVFILAGKGTIKRKIKRSLSSVRSNKIIGIMGNIDHQIQRYLTIKTIVSLITGILATIVFITFGVDFAILFGILVFLLNYIPTIGSIISTLLPLVVTVFQFETLWPAFWVLIFLTIIQQTMGSFVEPRLLGEGLGLSPLLVLFSLFFWGWLWGIPGMILAVPIASMVKIICSNIPSLEFIAELMSK